MAKSNKANNTKSVKETKVVAAVDDKKVVSINKPTKAGKADKVKLSKKEQKLADKAAAEAKAAKEAKAEAAALAKEEKAKAKKAKLKAPKSKGSLEVVAKKIAAAQKAKGKASILIGGLLEAAKCHFWDKKKGAPTPEYMPYVELNFDIKKSQANKLIAIAKAFDGDSNFDVVPMTLLSIFTKDTEAREAAAVALEAGESITHKWFEEFELENRADKIKAKEESKAANKAKKEAEALAQKEADEKLINDTEARAVKAEKALSTAASKATSALEKALLKHLGKLSPEALLGIEAGASMPKVNKAVRDLNTTYKGQDAILTFIEKVAAKLKA